MDSLQPSEVQLVVARLLDIFHRRTPWQRRLWTIGLVLALEETLEYGLAVDEGGLREEGLQYVCASTRRTAEKDPGVADGVRDQLLYHLKPGRLKTRKGRDPLRHLIERTRTDYLKQWRQALAQGQVSSIERASSLLASHLLDAGFSPDHLHRWITATRGDFEGSGLEALFLDAERVYRTPPSRYEILVPFAQIPPESARYLKVLEGPETAAWLEQQSVDGAGIRYEASVLREVEARDPWHAVEKVRDFVVRLQARATVGHPGGIAVKPAGWAFIRGRKDRFPLDQPRRQVEVHSLSRQGALFEVKDYVASRLLDDALELVAMMETGSPGAAIAGGWAAIEGLLAEPGEPGPLAADRLAALVACSYPRAELTTLSYRHDVKDDELGSSLAGSESNQERARLVADHLQSGQSLVLSRATDVAAERRMKLLLSDPAAVLSRVQRYTAETFRRVFNQRNIVMHAGSLASIAMYATLRTAPALVGAGIDRIAHFSLASVPTSPLALAARAEVELKLVGTPGGRSLVDLLE